MPFSSKQLVTIGRKRPRLTNHCYGTRGPFQTFFGKELLSFFAATCPIGLDLAQS